MKTMTIHNISDDVATALANPTPKRDLSEFVGIMTPEEAAEVERIIEEDCERIDPEEWPELPPSAFPPATLPPGETRTDEEEANEPPHAELAVLLERDMAGLEPSYGPFDSIEEMFADIMKD